jgi:alpha-maltose-1-phosphate synthase
MKALLLYPYPVEPDGLSLQGFYLAKGLEELGVEVASCDRVDEDRKEELYKKFKPDVVIGVGFWGNVPDLVLHPLKFGMKPVPWFNANGWVANYHKTLDELPLLVANSRWVKSTYMRDGLKGKNIEVCGIGFDPCVFYPAKDDVKVKKVRDKLGIKEGEIMLLTAGGDVTSKGAQEMFHALAKIKSEFPNWKYVLKIFPSFSARDHGKEEKKLIRELGLEKDRIVYLTDEYPPEKMAELIRACDVYAAPSRLEGFGMIQQEAMACGKPVISINVGGPRDIVVHGKTGFLVDVEHEIKLDREWVYKYMGFDKKKVIEFPIPKTFAYRADIDQLADCTLKLFKDKGLRERMGAAGVKRAIGDFHYNTIAKKMLGLIKEKVIF